MNAERERGKAQSAVYRYEKKIFQRKERQKNYLTTLVSNGKKTLVGYFYYGAYPLLCQFEPYRQFAGHNSTLKSSDLCI